MLFSGCNQEKGARELGQLRLFGYKCNDNGYMEMSVFPMLGETALVPICIKNLVYDYCLKNQRCMRH